MALTTDPFAELTARERELLTALANGWTNLQIASRIGISRNTVKYHLKNLYDKLGVSNRAMAVALYMSDDDGPALSRADNAALHNAARAFVRCTVDQSR